MIATTNLLRTNRYYIEFTDYCMDEFLPKQFTIVKLCKNPRSKAYSSQIVDELLNAIYLDYGLSVRATAYCSHTKVFMLFDKGVNINDLREKTKKFPNILMTTIDDISESYILGDIPKEALAQLVIGWLFNSYANEEEGDVFNNTLGHNIIFPNHKAFKSKWTDASDHYGKVFWNGRLFKNCRVKIGVKLSIDRYGLIYPKAEPFVETNPATAQKAGFRFPYEFDDYGRLVPARNITPKGKYWYQQGQKSSPAQIPFIKYENYADFSSSRMGILADFLETLELNLGEGKGSNAVLHLRPFPYDKTSLTTVTPAFKDDDILKSCIYLVANNLTISLLDDVEIDSQVKNGMSILKEVLNSFGIHEYETKYNPQKMNILIHHEKDYYKDRNSDQRVLFTKNHKNEVIQGIAVENISFPDYPLSTGDDEADAKKKKQYERKLEAFRKTLESTLKVCIISLGIKYAVINQSTNALFGTKKLNLTQKIYGAIRKRRTILDYNKEPRNIEDIFWVELAADEQSVVFHHFNQDQQNDNIENKKIFDGFNYPDRMVGTKNRDEKVEMLIWKDIDDIYQIKKTDEHVIPNVQLIRHNLKQANTKFSVNSLLTYLNEFSQDFEPNEISNYKNLVTEKLNSLGKEEAPYNELQKCLCANIAGCKTFYRQFSLFLKEEKGIVFNTHIRTKEGERIGYEMSNIQQIFAYQSIDYDLQPIKQSFSYVVGNKGNLKQEGIQKGFVVRRIVRRNGNVVDKDMVKTILEMSSVDFVRLEQWTVLPFMAKLLKEYSAIHYGAIGEDPMSDRLE